MTDTLSNLYAAIRKIEADARVRNREEFAANGGCTSCWGWNRELKWWTLDGACYDEFGPCSDCDNDAEYACPGTTEPRSRGGYTTGASFTDDELARIEDLKAQIAKLEERYAEIEEEKRIAKGKLAKVTKGRKVPVGTEGEIFWLGESRFGTRVGLRDLTGTVHWTAASNVEVIL